MPQVTKELNPLRGLANTNLRPVGTTGGATATGAGDKYVVADNPNLRLVATTGVGESLPTRSGSGD